MPKVSVIIPLYNKEESIGRALQSVFAQTYTDFDVIVVDDGSTDESVQKASEIAEGRFQLVSQPNQGPGAARNRGVQTSGSRYIAFLDADDELRSPYLEKSVANLESSGCSLSACASLRGVERNYFPPAKDFAGGPYRMPLNAAPETIYAICGGMHGSEFISREAILALGGFYEKRCLLGEDFYLWVQVLLNYSVYIELEPLMVYHTEDAEINLHYTESSSADWKTSRRRRPLPPVLTDAGRLRRNCPPPYQELLERFLAMEAISEALTRASIGDMQVARELVEHFPRMREYQFRYQKLRAKLAVPALAGGISIAKRYLRRRRA